MPLSLLENRQTHQAQ
uniref:Uncharacterized protein n=1 Tax=Anguilla anguilla TaxID=7936 RepID=A0A0E9SDD8_ANGAN